MDDPRLEDAEQLDETNSKMTGTEMATPRKSHTEYNP